MNEVLKKEIEALEREVERKALVNRKEMLLKQLGRSEREWDGDLQCYIDRPKEQEHIDI